MNWLDWTVLVGTLVFIAVYGIWKSRGEKDLGDYFKGSRQLPWWMIGLSVMATQASAITFMSTPGQAYDDGMRFLQFYFGLPIAMVILCVTFLPRFMSLNVYTAYEFLEKRFDRKTRTLAATLFLIQRGLAAGITIYAPAIILSTIFEWDLTFMIIAIGLFVILYTVGGGSEAVSHTQKQQMIVMMGGIVIIFFVAVSMLPPGISFSESMQIAGKLGKMNIVDFSFNLNDRYNIWSGLAGGLFLALAYFGTDQSQVARYISGSSLTESRLGLIFNGLVKIPMQFLILLCGIMVYLFYLFTPAPVFFNRTALNEARTTSYSDTLTMYEEQYKKIQQKKSVVLDDLVGNIKSGNEAEGRKAAAAFQVFDSEESILRDSVRTVVKKAVPAAETEDRDYVFLTFVLDYMPHGIIGLLLAVILCAAMSSTSSEINALASTTVVDFYKRSHSTPRSDIHYVLTSKWFTMCWGLLAIVFAIFSSLFENLIEAVNILGSLFYGTVLGIFLVAFYMKKTGGTAVFYAAVAAELVVLLLFFSPVLLEYGRDIFPDAVTSLLETVKNISFLWYNMIGCLLVMLLSVILSRTSAEQSA